MVGRGSGRNPVEERHQKTPAPIGEFHNGASIATQGCFGGQEQEVGRETDLPLFITGRERQIDDMRVRGMRRIHCEMEPAVVLDVGTDRAEAPTGRSS